MKIKQERTMRTLTGHKVNPANDRIAITVTDEPGAGGANHRYHLNWCPLDNGVDPTLGPNSLDIHFQEGPIQEVGVNGVTQEALLEIAADRLRSFQAGPYACRENALALTKIEEAQMWLHSRTLKRMQRGVEGTHEK